MLFSLTFLFKAERISGKQIILNPTSDASWHISSIRWLPGSSMKRFAKADESIYSHAYEFSRSWRIASVRLTPFIVNLSPGFFHDGKIFSSCLIGVISATGLPCRISWIISPFSTLEINDDAFFRNSVKVILLTITSYMIHLSSAAWEMSIKMYSIVHQNSSPF